jgi:phage gp36-like protein
VYSTPAEVRLALAPSLPSGAPQQDTAAAFGDDQLNDAIREADARIDGYLRGRYSVPVDPSAGSFAQVAAWSRDLAAYVATLTLYRNRPMENTNPAYLRYQQVMADLTAAAKGTVVLDLQPTTAANTGGYAGVVNTQPTCVFGSEDWGTPPPMGWGWPGVGLGPRQGGYGWR